MGFSCRAKAIIDVVVVLADDLSFGLQVRTLGGVAELVPGQLLLKRAVFLSIAALEKSRLLLRHARIPRKFALFGVHLTAILLAFDFLFLFFLVATQTFLKVFRNLDSLLLGQFQLVHDSSLLKVSMRLVAFENDEDVGAQDDEDDEQENYQQQGPVGY